VITVGLDTSTWVGMARVEQQDPEYYRGKGIHFEGVDGWRRVQLIANAVYDTLELWQPDLAIIENYALGMVKSPATIVTLVSIGAMIRSALYNRQIPWIEVRPSTLKKWTTGKGNAKKPEMAAAVKERWGYASPSDDVIDAFALAQFGQQLALTGLNKLPTGVSHGNGSI
jgi:crossover junction endodeoxyribonuclease RuvC